MERDQNRADIRWMTYPEAAEALGIELKSVQRRVARSGWERRKGNDGRQRIGVPLHALEEIEARRSDKRGEIQPDTSGLVELLKGQLEEAKEALKGKEAALTERSQAASEAREEAARLRGELDGVKLALEHFHEQLAQARRETAKATQEAQEKGAGVEALQRELEAAREALGRLQGRGLLARLFKRNV